MPIEPTPFDDGEPIEVGYVIAKVPSVPEYRLLADTHAAKKPVHKLPTSPPMACTAKISSASSMPR